MRAAAARDRCYHLSRADRTGQVTEFVRVTEMSDIIIASAGVSGGRGYDTILILLLLHNINEIAISSRALV